MSRRSSIVGCVSGGQSLPMPKDDETSLDEITRSLKPVNRQSPFYRFLQREDNALTEEKEQQVGHIIYEGNLNHLMPAANAVITDLRDAAIIEREDDAGLRVPPDLDSLPTPEDFEL